MTRQRWWLLGCCAVFLVVNALILRNLYGFGEWYFVFSRWRYWNSDEYLLRWVLAVALALAVCRWGWGGRAALNGAQRAVLVLGIGVFLWNGLLCPDPWGKPNPWLAVSVFDLSALSLTITVLVITAIVTALVVELYHISLSKRQVWTVWLSLGVLFFSSFNQFMHEDAPIINLWQLVPVSIVVIIIFGVMLRKLHAASPHGT